MQSVRSVSEGLTTPRRPDQTRRAIPREALEPEVQLRFDTCEPPRGRSRSPDKGEAPQQQHRPPLAPSQRSTSPFSRTGSQPSRYRPFDGAPSPTKRNVDKTETEPSVSGASFAQTALSHDGRPRQKSPRTERSAGVGIPCLADCTSPATGHDGSWVKPGATCGKPSMRRIHRH